MSFIDLGDEYNDVQESKPLPEGKYFLRVQDVTEVNEGGKHYLKIIHVTDDDMSDELGFVPSPVMHILSLPQITDDEKDVNAGRDAGTTTRFKLLNLKRYLTHFQCPMDGSSFQVEDLFGLTAKSVIRHEDYEGRPQAKLLVPQLESEAV